jgi:lipopolysaccharide biosynthesis protein
MATDVRCLAFYLPQFHPIPENDEWWGPGFTEWHNVVRARPRFKGHEQPHLPGELGFYDLRVPEVRARQSELATAYGIDGFVYYHYWFGGRRLLERPFDEVRHGGEPDLPFALCWANENWTRAWDGSEREILLQQHYGDESDLAHIRWLAESFEDPRYVRVDGKPVFLVYRATALPDPKRTADLWREEAARLGIGELHLCRVEAAETDRGDPAAIGFDAGVEFHPSDSRLGPELFREKWRRGIYKCLRPEAQRRLDHHYAYGDVVDKALADPPASYRFHRGVTPAWDNSARRRTGARILIGSTPEEYERWLTGVLRQVSDRGAGQDLVFVNAWNEWAEGNHLEPDARWGRAYLEAHRRARAVTAT